MRQENLLHAEYKGVKFACNISTTTVGRSKIIHEFANSNTDNIEDQGKNPRVYQLTAIIIGVDYRSQRDALLNAIDENAEPGILIHPWYGRIENAVAMPATFDENINTLGRLEIPITFRISDSEGIPAVTTLSTSGITNRRNAAISAVNTDFSETYSVTNEFPGNYEASQSKANNLVDSIRKFVTTTSISIQNSASFFAKVDSFSRNINSLVNNSEGMGEGIVGLIGDISDLYETSEQTLAVSQKFFNFGDGDIPINPTTAGLIERRQNNIAFNEAVQVAALSVAYQSASQIDFSTIEEVESVQRELEGEYGGLRF